MRRFGFNIRRTYWILNHQYSYHNIIILYVTVVTVTPTDFAMMLWKCQIWSGPLATASNNFRQPLTDLFYNFSSWTRMQEILRSLAIVQKSEYHQWTDHIFCISGQRAVVLNYAAWKVVKPNPFPPIENSLYWLGLSIRHFKMQTSTCDNFFLLRPTYSNLRI